VKSRITIRRLLSILVIAGLVLAPLSRPVMAETSSDASMQAMMGDTSAEAMATDMPCCPSEAPAPEGCDKCVFMAACMTKCFSGMTMTVFQPLFMVSTGLAHLQDDFWRDGLRHTPPEHPPRTLV
jgi:hypothetical protein